MSPRGNELMSPRDNELMSLRGNELMSPRGTEPERQWLSQQKIRGES
jgi:hypothetical protein